LWLVMEKPVLPCSALAGNASPGARISAAGFALPDVRLVGGPHRCAGRVEVRLDGRWGTVCDDGWGLNDVAVVCRQLDCGTAMEALSGKVFGPGNESDPDRPRFGQGMGKIWLDDIHCKGAEETLVYSLGVFADSGIPELTQLRQVNSPSRCAGRVEVLHNQQWGTVCDDSWDITAAGFVCRQLGCGTALSAPGGGRFGQGSGPIWLDDVTCTGTEAALSECRAKPWGDHNCHHGEDAGIVCSELTQLRLVNSLNRCAGRVEVLHNNQWGTVCHDNWDLTEARVVCRQLGCGTALLAPRGARFGRGSDHIWLDDLNCAGTEAALSECNALPWGENDCNHGEDAGVVCSGNLHLPPCVLQGAGWEPWTLPHPHFLLPQLWPPPSPPCFPSPGLFSPTHTRCLGELPNPTCILPMDPAGFGMWEPTPPLTGPCAWKEH
uniref:Soluble scavenger receptor cysteine-rich domain-containing protein SSC5D n=1 Tax=Chrysemys picta bellii TaxID=8478 RepID=A0A8C3H8L9_CHRPI